MSKPKVRIVHVSGSHQWGISEATRVEVDGELLEAGGYGGEPEDNTAGRDYEAARG